MPWQAGEMTSFLLLSCQAVCEPLLGKPELSWGELHGKQHRLGYAQADKAASTNSVGLRVHEMAVIPPGYNTGTVFLNGWRLAYQSGDHHVRGLGSAIFNIIQT